MLNYAICLKGDERFIEGVIYQCSCSYRGMTDILDSNQKLVMTSVGDDNFTFIFNVTDEIKELIESKYEKFQYKEAV